jgi:hypothetical protein
MISTIYNGLNDIPVDRLAASMLYQTKQWQEVPSEVKTKVIEVQLPDAIININYFSKPKERAENEMQIPDRRGRYFSLSINHKIETFIVTGYADEKKEWSNIVNGKGARKPDWWKGDNFDPNLMKKKCKTTNYWWCMNINSGEFQRFSGKAINRHMTPNYN